MQQILAMAWLTVKAATRSRLLWVLAVLLVGSVSLLPLMIKDDGTARGFTQILLTYTLAVTTALLGFATLWLGCGTLARDVEECQIQMVAVKPIGRWQIWLGKYFGLLLMNAGLLLLAGACIYGLLHWRARRLPEKQRVALQNEVMVARGSARPAIPDYSSNITEIVRMRIEKDGIRGADVKLLEQQVREQIKAEFERVRPDYQKEWKIDLGLARHWLKDQPLYLRVKFNAGQTTPSGTFLGLWEVGDPASPNAYRQVMSLAPDTFHEFELPPNTLDAQGVLAVRFINRNETALLFSLEEGVEVLYRVGGFGANFVRGMAIIFLWLMFLGAVGLAASSFLSFPVAAFVSVGVLVVGLSSGTIKQILEQGTIGEVNHETGVADAPMLLDRLALPFFQMLFALINLVRGFSPIDSLSTGRSISWGDLTMAFLQIGILLSGLLSLAGIVIFTRRELATAQGVS